jgi:NAD(P)-dependent dehydrogenase (short-subunit alcohol dehydrogenase family)
MALELRPHRIAVNAVLPQTLDTPANRAAMPAADFSKWISTDEVAAVIEWLLSPEASVVTGAVIPVNER